MQIKPEYTQWEEINHLLCLAVESKKEALLLDILLTADEKLALIARVNIINELLKGDINQRQLTQMLGVGIATVTRGSNALKLISEQQKEMVQTLLKK